MTDSANITVSNHRLRKAMSQANDDDLKSHTQKMGDKIRSELELKIGEILKIYPYKDKCEVKIAGTNQKTTCLIAHDILSEGMNVSGFPKGTTTHEKADEVIIPLETIYGIILDVNTGKKKQKCIVSYINLDRPHTKNNAKNGEYKIQVGDNKISVTDKYININSKNLFVNGLPYDSPELQNYYSKTTIDNIQEDNDNQLTEIIEKLDNIDVDRIIEIVEDFKKNFAVKVNTLPIASQDTLGKIYLVKNGNYYDEYLTFQNGETYSWEKIGSTDGSGGTVTWESITGKPSNFPPSSHNHGSLTNNGTLNNDTLIVKNIAVTDSNNSLRTITKLPYSKISETPKIPSKISDLENDGSFIETSSTNGLVRNDGTIDTTNYLSSLPSHIHDDRYYTETEIDSKLEDKQDVLRNQENIKSINGISLLGSGNITIQGGGGSGGSTIQGYYWDDSTKQMVLEYSNGSIADLIYPVGSIYMSVNNVNPSTLFGGEWVQIKDTFLLACGDIYSSDGDVATAQHGEATVSLTKSQMPRHNHTQAEHRHTMSGNYSDGSGSGSAYMYSSSRNVTTRYTDYQTPVINHTGGTGTANADSNGSPHNNMPPYMSVYVWKRVQ